MAALVVAVPSSCIMHRVNQAAREAGMRHA
jgi:hypothetical protein